MGKHQEPPRAPAPHTSVFLCPSPSLVAASAIEVLGMPTAQAAVRLHDLLEARLAARLLLRALALLQVGVPEHRLPAEGRADGRRRRRWAALQG